MQQLERSVEEWEREIKQLESMVSKLELELEALVKEEVETRDNLKVFEAEVRPRWQGRGGGNGPEAGEGKRGAAVCCVRGAARYLPAAEACCWGWVASREAQWRG